MSDAPAALDVAAVMRTVRELAAPGQLPTPQEAHELVSELRESAATAEDLVFDVMRLPAGVEESARRALSSGTVAVVDRLGWAQANAQTFSTLYAELEPLAAAPASSKLSRMAARLPGAVRAARATTRRAAAAQTGMLLALLSGRVLGQFDPLGRTDRLLLVAPNIYRTERAIDAIPRDFRLWVALHEQTHRVQFAAAPWLREHMRGAIRQFATGSDPNYRRLGSVLRRLPEAVRNGRSIVDLVADPSQQRVLDEVTAVMSLLEGHADVVVNAVGPRVIPTVDSIRRAFDAKRADTGGLRGVVADLLGVTDKLRQYERGAAFVRAIIAARGHAGLAAVWQGPEFLPRPAEIDHPQLWLERIPEA